MPDHQQRSLSKNKVFRYALYLWLVLHTTSLWGNIPGLEPRKRWDLDGYIKYMATYAAAKKQANTLDHLLHNRINFEYRLSPNWRFNLGMRNRAIWGEMLGSTNDADFVELDQGYVDLSKNWHEGDAIVNTQFDRLNITWLEGDWQARVGRFRVNWSMNTIWNPNDIFNAYSIYDFDYEERTGSDAISISKTLGFADGIEWVFSPSKNPKQNSMALRYLVNDSGWDYQFIAGKARMDHVLGLGLSGDIIEAGARVELSWFDPIYDDNRRRSDSETVVASVEADYSFAGERSWLGRVAWLYLSEPQQADDTRTYLNAPLDAKTLSFTNHTWYGDISFDLTALNRVTLSVSYYDDHSYFWGLSSRYSLANDWQLMVVIQSFSGTDDSVFGAAPTTLLFANIKYSF